MTEEDRKFAVARIKEEMKANFIHPELIKKVDTLPAEALKGFSEFHDLEGIRFCATCGKPFKEGIIWDGEVYCSVECTGMSQEEYDAQYDDDDCDCAFWTEWEI